MVIAPRHSGSSYGFMGQCFYLARVLSVYSQPRPDEVIDCICVFTKHVLAKGG